MLVWRWLNDVSLTDPVERKLAPLLQLALIGIVVALGVALVIALVQVGAAGLPPESIVILVVFVLALMLSLGLIRRGNFKPAAWVLMLALFLPAIRRLLAETNNIDAALLAFFLPIIIAGLFLSRRALVGLVLVSSVLAIYIIDVRQPVGTSATSFILNLMLVAFLIDALGRALRDELAAALVRNHELETARSEMEIYASQLAAANERLTITLQSIGDAVITTDAAGRIMLTNNVAQKLTGWTQADAQGQPLPDVFHIINEYTRATVENPVAKVLREGVIVGLANHTLLLAKDGREVPIDDSGAPIRTPDGKINGVVLVFRDITERKAAEQKEIELAALNERHRLARDLHDAVSQVLFSANVIAESLPRLKERNPEKAFEQLEQLHQLTQGAAAEMRTLLFELRPENLVNSKLEDLLTQLGRAIQARKRMAVAVVVKGEELPILPEEVHVALYRIAQEGFNNIARHANARQARVRFVRSPNAIELVIVDNGSGFDPRGTSSGFGLASMRERASAINAAIHIQSRRGTGTRVRVIWEPKKAEKP